MENDFSAIPPLLADLRQLPAGTLYALGDKGQLVAALTLCQRHAVGIPQWGYGRSRLSVDVAAERVYEVSLAHTPGGIAATCECAQLRPARTCAHRLAALLTLKRALVATSVSGWRPDEKRLEGIRRALLGTTEPGEEREKANRKPPEAAPAQGTKTASAVYAVELSTTFGMLYFTVTRNGSPAPPFDPGMPDSLQPLFSPLYASGSRPLAALTALLDRGEMRWPLLMRDACDRLRPLTVLSPVPRRGRLTLDARDDGVWIGRGLDDGSILGGDLLWLGSWVVDCEKHRLLRVDAPAIWDMWPRLVAGAQREQQAPGYRISWSAFSAIDLGAASPEDLSLEDLELQCAGRQQAVACAVLEDFRIDVEPDETNTDSLRLRPAVSAAGRMVPLDPHALALFTAAFFEGRSAPLRTFKRRRVLFETYFAARTARTRTERNRILRSALQTPDFRKRAVAREAREVLNDALDRVEASGSLLTFSAGQWQLLQRDRQREDQLLSLLYRHFGEPALRQARAPGEQTVRRAALFPVLPALRAELDAAGIDLRFAGLPVTSASLDIQVAAHTADIDWFELRPEIRHAGSLLPAESWRQALKQGFFEADGQLHLLDARDREALTILSGLDRASPSPRREIMRLPRLHILDLLALRRLGATLHLAADDAAVLASLESFETLPEIDLPRLGATLRDYQRQGYHWLAFLYRHKFGACLADDMGLGKTIQAISLLAALQQGLIETRGPVGAPHLVVVPPSLLFNWESEIARFAPGLRTFLYRGMERTTEFSGADVVLTSYELVRRDIDRLSAIPFHVIIFDETQAVKNVHAAVTGAVRRLSGVFKVALTGTPVENHLGEFWSIIDLLLPGLLGPYRRFGNHRDDIDQGELQRIIARTRPFILRRSKEKIAAELPDKVEVDLQLELTELQKTLYRQTVTAIRSEVAAAWQTQTAAQARITALAALTRLRRLCLDPRLVTTGPCPKVSPKIETLLEHLEELREEGHSALVFSQFTSFLDLVEPALTACGIPFLRLDGKTPVGARKGLVERFQHSAEPMVFLLSLKAGGRGLNLTRATYVFHLDPWWNPAVENQASDRAHRIGQTRKVTVLRMIMRHTVEEKMLLLKQRKERLYRALLEEGRDGGGVPLTREDFDFLVG